MRFNLLITLLLLCSSQLQAEDPWGPDADLLEPRLANSEQKKASSLGKIAQKLIRFHQVVISPADGPRSHFYPSSSQYTLDAIRRYGFLNGVPMGCDRLMRENNEEWVYRLVWHQNEWYKYDPIPE